MLSSPVEQPSRMLSVIADICKNNHKCLNRSSGAFSCCDAENRLRILLVLKTFLKMSCLGCRRGVAREEWSVCDGSRWLLFITLISILFMNGKKKSTLECWHQQFSVDMCKWNPITERWAPWYCARLQYIRTSYRMLALLVNGVDSPLETYARAKTVNWEHLPKLRSFKLKPIKYRPFTPLQSEDTQDKASKWGSKARWAHGQWYPRVRQYPLWQSKFHPKGTTQCWHDMRSLHFAGAKDPLRNYIQWHNAQSTSSNLVSMFLKDSQTNGNLREHLTRRKNFHG